MLNGIDDLSIEELQNQLLEIQKKIKEKEKESLIEKITASLRGRDLPFIQEVQAIVDGKKSLENAPRKEKQPSVKPFKIGKTEVYVRQGKVFFGIQEIKYTRLDKNNILRISKEGKGLPPKVSSLPPHIQKLVLALPQKNDSVATPTPTDDEQGNAETANLPAPDIQPPPEPESVQDPTISDEPTPVPPPETPPEAPKAESDTLPTPSVRKRKPAASKDDFGLTEAQSPEPVAATEAPTPPARQKEPVASLQESLF